MTMTALETQLLNYDYKSSEISNPFTTAINDADYFYKESKGDANANFMHDISAFLSTTTNPRDVREFIYLISKEFIDAVTAKDLLESGYLSEFAELCNDVFFSKLSEPIMDKFVSTYAGVNLKDATPYKSYANIQSEFNRIYAKAKTGSCLKMVSDGISENVESAKTMFDNNINALLNGITGDDFKINEELKRDDKLKCEMYININNVPAELKRYIGGISYIYNYDTRVKNYDSIKDAINNKYYRKLNENVRSIFKNTWAYKIIAMANDNDMNDRSFYNMMAIGKTFFEEIFKEITARTIHY